MPTPGPPFVDEIGEGGGVSWAGTVYARLGCIYSRI